MGCLFRLGCLVLLLCAAVVGWFTRDRWMPQRFRAHHTVVAAPTWESLSPSGAERTRAALSRLSQPRGPVFQTLSGADVASYVFSELAKQMPASADSIQAMVNGDTVALRANVPLADLGGVGSLGPVASMLGDRERVQMTGTFRVVQRGLGEFLVRDVKVGQLSLPHAMIARLLGNFSRGKRPAGLDPNALPLSIPPYVGDIRVANGKITLYKNVD
ncbi:MAG TPA: hypothetical protein VHB25_00715 [Gemmatimonadaceae bacterium]|nr:hypothetical protein [Gemmatimonadaceae bacterium]